jgi:hypothetical protein
MNKIETEFDKLKRYDDIETYYPPLEDIKDFLYELFGDRVESQKYIVRLNRQIDQLTNNWNELEEWLKELQKFKGINQQGFSWGVAQEVLDKMKEIKEREND